MTGFVSEKIKINKKGNKFDQTSKTAKNEIYNKLRLEIQNGSMLGCSI